MPRAASAATARGEAGIGQDGPGQPDSPPFHAEDGSGEAWCVGGGGDDAGGEDQLRTFGADHGLGVVGLAVFMGVGAAHQRTVGIGEVGLPCRWRFRAVP